MAGAVRLDHEGLLLEESGERLPLYSGALHYWRLERGRWGDILDRVRELGFRCVETYVPWAVHETTPGEFDFSGNRDLDAFLTLCEERELLITVRPGPHINAELTYFGYPARIIHDPCMQARTASGAPAIHPIPPKAFPIAGYCAEELYAETARWFDAVCPILARHLYPRGGIVLVQADNEHSYFFKLTPYDVDYSAPAISHYRGILAERYGTVQALNEAYGSRYTALDEVEPPSRFEAERAADLPRYLDWARFKERYITDGLCRIRDMLRERGLDGVPISHNTPQSYNVPYNQVEIERQLDVQGIDFYRHADEYDELKRGCLYLAGTSRLPFIPEFGAGTWPWWRPIGVADAEANALVALMHGIKAFNYYMLVERERWLGSPIGRHGDVREPEGDLYRRLLRFLHESGFARLRRRADVLLLYERDYERHAFTARLISPPFFPEMLGIFDGLGKHEVFAERDLGLGTNVPRAVRAWFAACYTALTRGHEAFVLGDSESDLAWLQRYRAIVCPGFAYMSRDVQERLAAYVGGGGTLLIGPEMPDRDELMRPCATLRSATSGIHLLERPEDLPAALRAADIAPAITMDNPELDIALHEDGERRVVFIANPSPEAASGALTVPGAQSLRGLWQHATAQGPERFTLRLAPYEIQIWEVA